MDRLHKMFVHLSQTAVVAFFLLLPALAGGLEAQVPPGEDWRTLDTPHFRVTYPAGLLPLAQRAAARAEAAWEALSRDFVRAPEGTIDLLLTDHIDVSNGLTRVFPSNRIVVFVPPPVDGFGLPHMDEWLELVITHELAHAFHQDRVRHLGGVLRTVMGRVPLEWPFFPGAATPGWFVEGLATYYESALTSAGRVRGTFHEMVVRTAILEDAFERIDQTSGDSPVWPGGQRYYIYGSMFLAHLMERYGPETMGAFAEAVAGQWIPYRLDAAAREAFGISFTEAWDRWEADLRDRYVELRQTLRQRAPLTEGESLTDSGFYAWSPEPSPDGSGFAFARSDGRSDPQLSLVEPESGDETKLARTNNLSQFSWTPSGELLFSQIEFVDSYRVRGDLFLRDREGTVRRVTENQRLDHPDVAPDGTRAVAVQEGVGTNRLVLVSLPSGTVEPLTEFTDNVHWAYPRWSPDGTRIAVSRWTKGAFFDLVLLSPRGVVQLEVTEDRSIDNGPAWSPDGRWLLWASDRSGIPNLFAVSVDPTTGRAGPVRQVTNVLGGAAYPSVDPSGQWIYFSSYHAGGWHIERIPFEPGSWFEPFPLHTTFAVQPGLERLEATAEGRGRPYSPLPTIRPTFWAPTYREGDQAGDVEVLRPGYGIFTSGEDLVGRHRYSLAATVARGVGSLNGRISYAYGGLENPVISVAAAQSHEAASRPLGGITEAGDTVPLFLVERERALGIGLTFLRKRSRHETALSLSASHVWENRFLLEEDLRRSSRFRLNRSDVRLGEARATFSFGTARRFSLSLSPEDGVGLVVRGRVRRDLTLADSLRDMAGSDRSFQDVVAQFVGYKGFRGPGFGNHVLGLRAAFGLAGGPGADAFHFEAGGASGSAMPIDFVDVGESLLFPIRGYETAARFGRRAWTLSGEYRFPIGLVNRGSGLLPLHLDWVAGTLFFDAGNAWGPDQPIHGFQNPKREALASAGGEIVLRVLPLWFQTLDVRIGAARPLVEAEEVTAYLRLGFSF